MPLKLFAPNRGADKKIFPLKPRGFCAGVVRLIDADPGGVPFEAGLKETYRWYLRHHKPRTAGFEFDDKLLGMARAVSTVSV
jgi:hypothetical protein